MGAGLGVWLGGRCMQAFCRLCLVSWLTRWPVYVEKGRLVWLLLYRRVTPPISPIWCAYRPAHVGSWFITVRSVAEPSKLSRLKCVNHHHKGNINLNALQTEQFLVCRVTSRYNHRFSDRTSIPRTKASSETLQPQFFNTGIAKITTQFK